MITSKAIRKVQASKMTRDDLLNMFEELGPMTGTVAASWKSMGWFAKQVLCNQSGRPLELLPFQMVMLDMLWKKKFPMIIGARGCGKTYILAVYCILRAILVPGSRIVICGAGYRQAKLVFKYVHALYKASPIIQECCDKRPTYASDEAYLDIGLSRISAIPIGDGEKVRGMRATVLLLDEFASIAEEIFEVVLAPFTAVHADPARRVKIIEFANRIKSLGGSQHAVDAVLNTMDHGNQIVISGTASYQANHFYKRYRVYKMFINTKGDKIKLKRAIEEQSLSTTGKLKSVDPLDVEKMTRIWRQYAIFQLPYYGVPEGFLDEDVIRSNRASFSPTRFAMEYEAKFPEDTDGFIKRSWIEAATPRQKDGENPVNIELYGDPRATYVMGIDPARHNDNIAAVVIKLTSRGNELVYVSTWNRTAYKESAHKIREICKRFNIQYICMDQGGGGDSILDWLHQKQDNVEEDEYLWPIKEQLEQKADLSTPGRKIVELVNFTSATADMAHGLEAGISNSNILFPYKGDDELVRQQYVQHFKLQRPLNQGEIESLNDDLWGEDTEEDERRMGIFEEINETTNEVCAIVRDVTPMGVERFILPNLSDQPEGLDMRRRDRFSALMLANYAAKIYLGHGHRTKNQPGMAANNSRKRGVFARKSRRRGNVRY
jgi:hypothetical protein